MADRNLLEVPGGLGSQNGIRMTSKKHQQSITIQYNYTNTSSFTAYSFVELVKYLFTVPGVEVFFS